MEWKKARWENSLVGEPRSHKLMGRQEREKDIEEYTECDIIYFKNLYLYLYIFIHNLYKHLSINYCVYTDSGLLLEVYTR